MDERKLVRFGGIGTALGIIVCFTPAVVAVLASVGLGAWLSPVDSVFHFVLAGGIGAMGYGAYRLWKKNRPIGV